MFSQAMILPLPMLVWRIHQETWRVVLGWCWSPFSPVCGTRPCQYQWPHNESQLGAGKWKSENIEQGNTETIDYRRGRQEQDSTTAALIHTLHTYIWIVAEIRLWCAAQWLCVHPNSIKMWTAAMCPKRWRSILRGRCKEIILFPAHLSDALLLQLAFFLRSIINSPGSRGSRGWGRSLFCRGEKNCGIKYFEKAHY